MFPTAQAATLCNDLQRCAKLLSIVKYREAAVEPPLWRPKASKKHRVIWPILI